MRWLLLFCCFFTALVIAPRLAMADQVAVLPFTNLSAAKPSKLEDARAATRAAVLEAKHTLPTDAQMLSAEMAMKSGAGTMQEFSAAGRASGSEWTVTGRVDPRFLTYRLELVVCRVDVGVGQGSRVETLAREIEPSKQVLQIAEMLALLLRPEGIANADIPWEHAELPKPPPPPKVEPPKPPAPPAVRHAYAEGRPIGIGIAMSVLTAASRAKNALGPAESLNLGASVGYALGAIRGLELRANFAGSALGPESIAVDAGARYMFPVVPTARFFVGPEATIGMFGTLAGEKTARFLMRGAIYGSLGIGDRVQVELGPDFAYAAGGTAGLLLAGVTARGMVRF